MSLCELRVTSPRLNSNSSKFRDSLAVQHHAIPHLIKTSNLFPKDDLRGLECLQGTITYVPRKCWYTATRLHGVIAQKTIRIFNAVEISNLLQLNEIYVSPQCSLLNLRRINYILAIIQLKLSASHKTHAFQCTKHVKRL